MRKKRKLHKKTRKRGGWVVIGIGWEWKPAPHKKAPAPGLGGGAYLTKAALFEARLLVLVGWPPLGDIHHATNIAVQHLAGFDIGVIGHFFGLKKRQ